MIPRADYDLGRCFATIGDVAILLRCNRRTVERLIYRHSLPAVRVGRGIRIPLAMLDAWLKQAVAAPACPWKRRKREGVGDAQPKA